MYYYDSKKKWVEHAAVTMRRKNIPLLYGRFL